LHPRERCLSPISAVDLLSRELEERPDPELGAYTLLTLATFIEPRTRHACTERDTIRPRDRKLAVAGITCLEWRVGLAPTSPAVTLKPPPCGMLGRPSKLVRALSTLARAEDSEATDAPFTNRATPGCPEPARRARALSARDAPTPRLPRLGNVFHPRILAAYPLAGARSDLQTTNNPRLCTPGPAVRHAFTHSGCALDSTRRGYSPKPAEPHAVNGILHLKRSSNTPTCTPNPNRGSKPPRPDDTAPCRALPVELSQPRGYLGSDTLQQPPHDRSRNGSTPT